MRRFEMRFSRVRVAVVLFAVCAAIVVPLTLITLASANSGDTFVSVVRQATSRFGTVAAAKAAGWNGLVKDKKGITCIANQPVGGMGVHYANGAYLTPTNTKLEPKHPQALVYVPTSSGKLKLGAIEYIVFASAWKKAGHANPPSLFGQRFALTPAGNRFGIPAFYSLHVWAWDPNSSGTFQPWNPGVRC
jgi:hypothetical protein